MNRFVAQKASACPPSAIVIPFCDEESAVEVAAEMNKGSKHHLTHDWFSGPAQNYVFDENDASWVVLDTQQGSSAKAVKP